MTFARLFAIALIFFCTCIAWFTLGASVVNRTGETDYQLQQEVAQLWGGQHIQNAPSAWYEQKRIELKTVEERAADGSVTNRQVAAEVTDHIPVPVVQSRVNVKLDLDQRRKGLLWYDTYGVDLSATYQVKNPDPVPRTVLVHFDFPSAQAIYDSFRFQVGGQDAPPVDDLSKGVTATILLAPGAEEGILLSYRSRGLGDWNYMFGTGVSQVRDFLLTLTTDFHDLDFPAGSISPSTRVASGSGDTLTWKFDSLVTGQKIGVDLPDRANPGPLASRISFFAPISLLFFVTVMVILGALRGRNLHPMNYFFISAGFFAFHLLLAYLVDHLDIHAAFAIASGASIFLVVSYLRLVSGWKFAVAEAGVAQMVFLVLFSYAFFFEGYTGLTVTVGAVLTLFVMMQLTGRVDWNAVFASRPEPARPTTPPRAPAKDSEAA